MSAPSDSQRPPSQSYGAASMEKIVSLCKRRGFIFQSSEIYGGLNGLWDYGPLGVELKRNLKNYWWRVMVHERDDVVGLDGSILMNRAVWEASGHEATFSDLMVECPITKRRYRVDQIEPQMSTILRYSGAADREALKEAIDSVFGDEADPRREKLEAQIREVGLAESLQESTDPVIRDLAGRIRDRINQGSRMVQWPEPFEVLVPLGKSREAARKTAIQFYRSMGLMNPTLEGETEEKLDKPTSGFSPDN